MNYITAIITRVTHGGDQRTDYTKPGNRETSQNAADTLVMISEYIQRGVSTQESMIWFTNIHFHGAFLHL